MASALQPKPISLRRFEHAGFEFLCSDGPIGDKRQYHELEDSLGVGPVPLPEMMFPNNFISVVHKNSGLRLLFKADNALKSWHAQQLRTHGDRGADRPAAVDPEHFDWTFSTDYEGTVGWDEQLRLEKRTDEDVYSSTGAASCTTGLAFTRSTASLPLARLADRTLPIRFFHSTQLYASDLDDRGTAECVVKIRVMEGFWLILCRSWCRIDRERIAVRDVRYYCEWETGQGAGEGEGKEGGKEGEEMQPQGEKVQEHGTGQSLPVPLPPHMAFTILKDVQERRAGWEELQAALRAMDEKEERQKDEKQEGEHAGQGGTAARVARGDTSREAFVSGSTSNNQATPSTTAEAVSYAEPTPLIPPTLPDHGYGYGTGYGGVAAVMPRGPVGEGSAGASTSSSSSPVPPPRSIHPAVLASIQARAAKQGLTVDEYGRMLPASPAGAIASAARAGAREGAPISPSSTPAGGTVQSAAPMDGSAPLSQPAHVSAAQSAPAASTAAAAVVLPSLAEVAQEGRQGGHAPKRDPFAAYNSSLSDDGDDGGGEGKAGSGEHRREDDYSSSPFSLSSLRLAITADEAYAALQPVHHATWQAQLGKACPYPWAQHES